MKSDGLFNLAFLALCAALMSPTAWGDLVSPYDNDTYRPRWSSRANLPVYQDCPALAAPVVDLNANSIYTDDPCRCIIDPVKQQAYLEATAPTKEFAQAVVKLSDQYVTTETPQQEIAACTLSHLDHWASHYAMLGDLEGSVAFATLTNVLGPSAQAYLKIRDAEGLDLEAEQRVRLWLKNLARRMVHYHKLEAGPKTTRNNHRYWDAYAVLGAAIADSDNELFLWANESLDIGLSQITEDGTLPLEMARGDKAHSYHVYALSPLIGLAESIHINRSEFGLNSPFNRYNHALQRLSDRILVEEINGPSGIFPVVNPLECHQSAWAELFLRRNARLSTYYNAPALATYIGQTRDRADCGGKLYFTGLGGSTTYSFGLVNLQKVIDGMP